MDIRKEICESPAVRVTSVNLSIAVEEYWENRSRRDIIYQRWVSAWNVEKARSLLVLGTGSSEEQSPKGAYFVLTTSGYCTCSLAAPKQQCNWRHYGM